MIHQNNKGEGGYIREKKRSIGFKSVFLVTSQPYIFNNGYKIRFNEVPPAKFNIGYIIPEWVESRPNIAELEEICGCKLPNTVIVLPLCAKKFGAVQKELSSIKPEVILFM
jgi:sacsin